MGPGHVAEWASSLLTGPMDYDAFSGPSASSRNFKSTTRFLMSRTICDEMDYYRKRARLPRMPKLRKAP